MDFSQRLQQLSTHADALTQFGRGLERESLRITADRHLSQLPHPVALGSALTNKWITTDFACSQVVDHRPSMVTQQVTNFCSRTLEVKKLLEPEICGRQLLKPDASPKSVGTNSSNLILPKSFWPQLLEPDPPPKSVDRFSNALAV